jgi:hypothetical protein
MIVDSLGNMRKASPSVKQNLEASAREKESSEFIGGPTGCIPATVVQLSWAMFRKQRHCIAGLVMKHPAYMVLMLALAWARENLRFRAVECTFPLKTLA